MSNNNTLKQSKERAWSNLMVEAQNGNNQAYEKLLQEIMPVLKSFFRKKTGQSSQILDDLAQDTILGLHSSRNTYQPEKSFTTWMFAIANYKAIDFFRNHKKIQEVSLAESNAINDSAANQSNQHLSSANESNETESINTLQKLLDELPSDQRKAIELTKFQGLSINQAAEVEGVNSGALRVRLHRAYKNIKKKLLKNELS